MSPARSLQIVLTALSPALLTSMVVAAPSTATTTAATTTAATTAGTPVDFETQVLPILKRACVSCHGPEKAQGGLQLVSAHRLFKGGIGDDIVVPGDARKSYLVQRMRGEGGEDLMPLKKPALPATELALIERWIDEGAKVDDAGPPKFVPAPGGLKRLTAIQYQNTLRDVLGANVKLTVNLEPDTLVAGSASVGAARIGVSGAGIEKYSVAAFDLARQAMADPAFRQRYVPCEVTGVPLDEACARGFLEQFGRRAWRRPLAPEELARYLRLQADVTRRGLLAHDALVSLAGALLQSPNFLYRSETGVAFGNDPSRRRLTDYELASRLSYFIWGAPPDDELLNAAESGKLATDAGLHEQSARMLQSPRAKDALRGFFIELFRMRRLDRINENRTKYPNYSKTIGTSMKGEALRIIEEVAFNPKRDFREIFSTDFTYVNAELAKLYGIKASALDGARLDQFVRVPAPAGRSGLLSQGAFLTVFAHPTTSSPTRRGKFIRESLLCQSVPPPPPSVETKLPKDEEGKPLRTTRQKLEAHRNDEKCRGCHKAMDPLGLAFEHYDGLGARRETEGGQPIDASGEFDGTTFKGPTQLGALLAKNTKIGACVARSLFRFAVGHLESEGEEPLMEALAKGLETDGYFFPSLVANVIKSEGFRTISVPQEGGKLASGKLASGKLAEK
jgi:hypothetical protein